MMMKKLLALLMAASLLPGLAVSGTTAESGWQWQREIKTDEASRFNRFEISPEIYAKSQLSLGDLRIVDSQGKAVPYIHDAQREITTHNGETYPFTLDRTFRKNNDTSFDFAGLALSGRDLTVNRLTAEPGYTGDFFKYLELYGSYDGTQWEWIGNDSFYRVAGTMDDGIVLDTPQKYAFYRITLLDNSEGITLTSLTGAMITTSEKLSKRKIIFDASQFSRTENQDTTEIRLKGFRNLPVRTLSIDAEGLFQRPSQVFSGDADATGIVFGSGYLYQSTLKGTEPLKNSLPVDIASPYATLKLLIENGDNPPLKIQSIILEYAADTLIFEPVPGKTYHLQYGNPAAAKPQYDLEQFKNEIAQQGMGTAALLTETPLKDPEKAVPASFVSQKTIFSTIIFTVAILMAWLAIRGIKKNTPD